MKMKQLLGATALVGILAGFPMAASAQTAPESTTKSTQDDEAMADTKEAITVTGSRIRRPNLESTVPITSIAGDVIFQQGQTSVGDLLNDLPQLRSTFAQQNPGLGIGIAGLNLLDLRGLGTVRTLVLVNGRRHVPADILNNAASVDVSTIPSDLIERVDIVTGGNSAIYGSDAIAGVVNFVLRRDYQGVSVRGQAGVTQAGFGGNQYISLLAGRNFAGGRGNITLHGEYNRTDRVFASDVPAFRSNDNFATVDSDGGAGIVNGGDGFPDTAFFTDIRSSTISTNGLVPINQRNLPNTGLCGNATTANNGGPNTLGTAFNCTYLFDEGGRLFQQTGTRFGTGLNPTIVGGNGQTGREGQRVSVLPFTERYNFNLVGHFEFSPAAELFVEAKWNRINALGNNAGPSFNQGTRGTADVREDIRLDNPFLNPADRTTLSNLILASGCRTSLLTTCPAAGNLTATDIANIANGSFRFVNSRSLIDVGLRDERFQRDTYRVVGGLRGTFNDDWNYEVSVNYGKFKEDVTTGGFIDRQRYALANDAGRNPLGGAIQCRSQFDPASAFALTNFTPTPATGNTDRLAADIAACVPYNPFGAADNRASVAYFSRTFTASSGIDQLDISGFVGGDSSQLFELPGGPVKFALGGEYRREQAFYQQDPFVTNNFTNGVSIPSFTPNAFVVTEAFGELQVPIFKDQPFLEELTLSGAGRVSFYQGNVGTVYTYNGGADYSPVKGVRFRFNYGRAVRAPNVSETGFPLVPNFSNGFNDPCNPANIGAGVRAANCLADLGPTLLAGLNNVTQSLPIVSGSNPNLNAETSDSFTYGIVYTPSYVPGLAVTVDYYNITVNGIIASIAPNTLVNQCYDSPNLNNVFCGQFTRFRGPGIGPNGETPGRILGNSLISAPLNFARRVRKGLDVNVVYRHDFGALTFNTNLIYTHNFAISNFQDPTNPNFESRVLGQLGDPSDEFRWDFDFTIKPVTLGYRLRYIGPQFFAGFNSTFPLNGLPPQNIDAFPSLSFAEVFYSDLRLEFNVAKDSNGNQLRFYTGVDNVLNQGVPLGATTATGGGSAIYSFRGRNFYAGFRANF